MLTYIFGEETYTTFHRVEEMKKAYMQKMEGRGNVVSFDCGEKCNVSDICNMFGAQDLFTAEKMIIIKDLIQVTKSEEQKILQKAITKKDHIVFWETGIPRKNAFFASWLGENADEIVESKKLLGRELSSWIMTCIKDKGAKIDREAVEELILYINNDLWHLVQEIEKLVAYAQGREIVIDDVHTLVHGQVDADMFVTIEALTSHDKGRALMLLKKQLAKGDDPFYVFSMYAYHIRTLLLVGNASEWGKIQDKTLIAKNAGIHPFVVQKSLSVIKNISQKMLTNAHRHLTTLDREIKTGKRDIHSALDLFVVNI